MPFPPTNLLHPWAIMWIVAFTLFGLFKWITWSCRTLQFSKIGFRKQFAYCFGWVGFDADEFCTAPAPQATSSPSEWLVALGFTSIGAIILWGGIRFLPADRPALIGAFGFAGIILLLHFGLFHMLALVWRRAGVAVEPIMDHPFLAVSLADFWGRRWNRAYRRISFDYFFLPFVRRFGSSMGTLLAFISSGLIHELVISFPAGAGYGGPTAYFAIQGLALLAERTSPVRKLMQNPFCGWLYTAVFVLAPAGLLFHAPFLTRVIVPFLEWIGAR
jgi:alginate O-acetyltransferase complex protein AlgI